MKRTSEHTGLISSLSLLLVQTQAARWKAATSEQLTGAHLYQDIAKSGYLFHEVGNVMCLRVGVTAAMISVHYFFLSFFPNNLPAVNLKNIRTDYRFAPSQWEMVLLCNNISHWQGAGLELAVNIMFLLTGGNTYLQWHLLAFMKFIWNIQQFIINQKDPLHD